MKGNSLYNTLLYFFSLLKLNYFTTKHSFHYVEHMLPKLILSIPWTSHSCNIYICNFKWRHIQFHVIVLPTSRVVFISDNLKRKLVVSKRPPKKLCALFFHTAAQACSYKYLNSLMVPINTEMLDFNSKSFPIWIDTYHKFTVTKILSLVLEIL